MNQNIVLICLDSVRKDYFDDYSTRLRQLSDTSFDQCRAASSWSVPSHASMITGKLPHQHGAHTHNPSFVGIDKKDTFLGELDDFHRVGISSNVWASPSFGFNAYFDEFLYLAPHNRSPDGLDVKKFLYEREASGYTGFFELFEEIRNHENPLRSLENSIYYLLKHFLERSPLPSVFDDGAKQLIKHSRDRVKDEPLFLFMNFMDAHSPARHVVGYDRSLHSAPYGWSSSHFKSWKINVEGVENYEDDLKNYRELYGASIDYLDRKVSSLIRYVQDETENETTFIITSDHGENLGYIEDGGLIGHMSSLSEAVLHVPLLIINPPFEYGSTGYFSHLELGDLVLSIANEEPKDVFRERIPAELIGGGPPVTNAPLDNEKELFWNRMQRCVYEDTKKYVWDSLGNCHEYELDGNRPCWQKETSTDCGFPDWIHDFFEPEIEYYKEAMVENHGTTPIDKATQRRLEKLGYR